MNRSRRHCRLSLFAFFGGGAIVVGCGSSHESAGTYNPSVGGVGAALSPNTGFAGVAGDSPRTSSGGAGSSRARGGQFAAAEGGATPGAGGSGSSIAGQSGAPGGGSDANRGGTGSLASAGSGGSAAHPAQFTTGGHSSSMAGTGGSGAPNVGGSAGSVAHLPLTLYIAGDSTVSTYTDTSSTKDQAGWGQKIPEFLDKRVTVENRAIGGRTARRFIDEGYLDEIWSDIKPGDFLMVQFGTNDGNKTANYTLNGKTIPYYLDPETDFPQYLRKYVDGARTRKATPVLVTPPPRNSAYCTGGNGTAAHAQAMRDLGAADGVLVIDLNQKAVNFLKAICPAPTPEDFFLLKADGSVDGTHFQENGARKLAQFVADGLVGVGLSGTD